MQEGNTLSHPCLQSCGVHYCSTECRDLSFNRHMIECPLIKQANSSQHCKKIHSALSLLLSISSNESDICELLTMMLDTTKIGQKQYKLAESQFRRLDHGTGAGRTCREGEGVYAAALASQRLNAIGLFDEYGEELGCVLCPVVAMVNHSCLPNCQVLVVEGWCRLVALRELAAGEELSYSYVSMQGSARDRRRAIENTWQFTCRCERCVGRTDCAVFDREHVCYCGSISVAVERSQVAECRCNAPRILPPHSAAAPTNPFQLQLTTDSYPSVTTKPITP
jgi:hypothetical protein